MAINEDDYKDGVAVSDNDDYYASTDDDGLYSGYDSDNPDGYDLSYPIGPDN